MKEWFEFIFFWFCVISVIFSIWCIFNSFNEPNQLKVYETKQANVKTTLTDIRYDGENIIVNCYYKGLSK